MTLEKYDKYSIDIINQYVMDLKSKLEKLAVIACYGYVSQEPDVYEGDNKNVFYNEAFKCYSKRRRIDSISQFVRDVGLEGVNEYELKKLLFDDEGEGLPQATATITYWDKKQRRKIELTIKNFLPVILLEEHDKETGEKLGDFIQVMAWDPIMHNWFASLKSNVREALREYTTKEFNLGLRLINYYRENLKRVQGKKLVRNLSKENVDKVLNIDDNKFPVQRDELRDRALRNSKDIGILKGYKFFPDSKMFITPCASVEELADISRQELTSVGKMNGPEMVTLVFKTESFIPKSKPKKAR
jgi:hypothetical protein